MKERISFTRNFEMNNKLIYLSNADVFDFSLPNYLNVCQFNHAQSKLFVIIVY